MKKLFILFMALFVIVLASSLNAEIIQSQVYLWWNATNSNNTEYYSKAWGNLTNYGSGGNVTGSANTTQALLFHGKGLLSWNCTSGDFNATLEHKPYGSESWLAIAYRDNSTVIEMVNSTGAHTITSETDTNYRVKVSNGTGHGQIWLQRAITRK